jgi:hypothetical protein
LGEKLRAFQQKTCTYFKPKELWREANAWNHKQAKDIHHNPGHARSGQILSMYEPHGKLMSCPRRSSQPSGLHVTLNPDLAIPSNESSQRTAQQLKTLNLNMYKFHALGHNTSTIWQYGTTDSYSTEAVHIHCFHKDWFHWN